MIKEGTRVKCLLRQAHDEEENQCVLEPHGKEENEKGGYKIGKVKTNAWEKSKARSTCNDEKTGYKISKRRKLMLLKSTTLGIHFRVQ
jgi:hypothetical protein